MRPTSRPCLVPDDDQPTMVGMLTAMFQGMNIALGAMIIVALLALALS